MAVLSVVVIPARDEELRIGACLRALAAQTIAPAHFEILIVADACVDGTERVAVRLAAQLGLTLRVLPGPGRGAGVARRIGMDAAATRLRSLDREDGLIACTDADSCPHPDWLAAQLRHLAAGAEAVAGTIELDPEEARALPEGILRRRERDAVRRLRAVHAVDAAAEHHHFAGASLGVTPRAYLRVGGLDPLPALEDAAFAARLAERGIPIVRAGDVRVSTSARTGGRTRRGLSVDLAVSEWLERGRRDADDYPLERLRAAKGESTVSVIIPTRECAATIGEVLRVTVAPLADAGLLDEVVVVDAGSTDGTAELAARAGARVLQQDELAPELGPALGKGDAMWRAVAATRGEIVLFLDGDTLDPDSRHLRGLLGPLLCEPGAMLVKGTFDRPLSTGAGELPHEGGRVTELMARPLINLHEPLLAGFSQPLAGEFGARRELLERIPFPVGYGIEIASLIDALRLCGLPALRESRLGERRNRHQPLRALGEMAYAVLAAVERRLEPRNPVGGHYLRPWEDGATVMVPVLERPALAERRVDEISASTSSSVG